MFRKSSSAWANCGLPKVRSDDAGSRSNRRLHSLVTPGGQLFVTLCYFVGEQHEKTPVMFLYPGAESCMGATLKGALRTLCETNKLGSCLAETPWSMKCRLLKFHRVQLPQ